MYASLFEPTTFAICLAIYALGAMCLVLAVKLYLVERANKKHMEYILYLNDRLTKLEEERDQA